MQWGRPPVADASPSHRPAREDTLPRIRLIHSAPTLTPMSVDRSFLTLGLDIAEQAPHPGKWPAHPEYRHWRAKSQKVNTRQWATD